MDLNCIQNNPLNVKSQNFADAVYRPIAVRFKYHRVSESEPNYCKPPIFGTKLNWSNTAWTIFKIITLAGKFTIEAKRGN